MDIGKLDIVKLSNEGFPCVIKNPKTGEDSDIVITLKGVFAGTFRDESENANDAETTAALLAKYTISWSGLEENGCPVEFSEANAQRIYRDFPIIRGQVLTAAMDVRNFIKD